MSWVTYVVAAILLLVVALDRLLTHGARLRAAAALERLARLAEREAQP
jgi:hypothetical protein